jgi:probable F420-dependent oxidoreductase
MTSAPPALSLALANFSATPADSPDRVIRLAELADQLGIDRVIVVDHVVMGAHIEAYDGGRFPTGPDGAWFEPLTLLAVLAGVTQHVRLATGILLAALRRPAVLAKTIATLDVVSGGRVDLGVGVGWQREEYEAAGLRFEDRGRLLDETLEVCTRLWRDRPASYSSDTLAFDGIWCEPKPLQPEGVPIWVSGRIHRRTIDRVVKFGSGWIPWAEHRADPLPGIARLRRALAEAGRDPAALQVRGVVPIATRDDGTLDLEAAVTEGRRQVAGGVTDLQLGIPLPRSPDESADTIATVVAAFRRM